MFNKVRKSGSGRLSDFPEVYLMSIHNMGDPSSPLAKLQGWRLPPCLPVASSPSDSAEGNSSSAIQGCVSHLEDFTLYLPEGSALAVRSLGTTFPICSTLSFPTVSTSPFPKPASLFLPCK